MKKRILLLITILSLIMCTACGAATSESGEEAVAEKTAQNTEQITEEQKTDEKNADEKNAEDVIYPITVIDQAGREVVIEEQPKSLVSIYYITTSVLLALDLKDEIKGVESNPEKRNIYNLCAPELFEVTKVGSPKEFDLEACASVNPDLVILPLRAKDMVEPLEELGITVLVVNPESQNDIFEMIELMGTVTGKGERAQELVYYIQGKLGFLSEQLSEEEAPSVYLGGNSSFFSTASKGMYQNDLISLAGGKNVAGEIDDTYWVEVDYEQILEWNPEYIVLASQASYSIEDIQKDDNLSNCQAIQNENVYKIPVELEDWDSPVPSSFLGVAYLASVLHPDAVTKEQYEEMVKEYYETFYGFTYSGQ